MDSSNLSTQRLKEILCCVLNDVATKTDMDKETYLNWLTLEIGFSKDEISQFEKEGYMRYPEDPIEY